MVSKKKPTERNPGGVRLNMTWKTSTCLSPPKEGEEEGEKVEGEGEEEKTGEEEEEEEEEEEKEEKEEEEKEAEEEPAGGFEFGCDSSFGTTNLNFGPSTD
jgi:hypothetical protein